MIRQLRRKFVLTSVAILTATMLMLTLVINIADRVLMNREIRDTVSDLFDASENTPKRGRRARGGKHGESLYESRYFTVTVGPRGMLADLSNVTSYTEEEACEMAQTVLTLGRDEGFLDECYYMCGQRNDRTFLVFLDCGSRLAESWDLTVISVISCCAGILAACITMTILSNRAIRPVLESTEKQKRFITDASHELKTPLSVINANMEVMALDDPDNEWIHSTRRQTGLMTKMVNDLVFLSRSEEETERPVRMEFDLADLLRETSEPFSMIAEAGGRTLSTQTREVLKVYGNRKAIEKLIGILCDNALKYSPKGDTIILRLHSKGAYAVIESENTPDTPIPPEKLKHFFERFYRADDSRTKNTDKGGFGIGLAIALAVCESHGGTAKATLKDGRLFITCRLRIIGRKGISGPKQTEDNELPCI